MNQLVRRRAFVIALTLSLAIVFAIAIMSARSNTVNAGSPPPDVPKFEGEPFTATLPESVEINREPLAIQAPQSDWVIAFSENFESVNWENQWTNLSLNGQPYKWDARAVANPLNPASQFVGWAVGGGGQSGGSALDPSVDGYPPNVDSWLVAGPFNMSDAIDAQLTFSKSFSGEAADTFGLGVSTDGSTYTGVQVQGGGDGSWSTVSQSLTSYAGEPQVWFAFVFRSQPNSTNPQNKPGPFLDDVQLNVKYTNKTLMPFVAYGFTPTPLPPTPTPTATAQPPSNFYRDDFTNNINTWAARRWTLGAAYDIQHRGDCDGGRCGFLQMENNTKETYVLASPLVQSRAVPYNIQVEALFKGREGTSESPKAGQSYSIIFGGNWNGQACPKNDFTSCFTQYYEFRVEYVDSGKVVTKLKKVEGHDGSNQNFGPDLFSNVNVRVSGWIKWDITVRQDGTICIAANKKPITNCVRDTTYLNNRYFGLMARNAGNSGARIKFDYYQIDWPDNIQELLNLYDE